MALSALGARWFDDEETKARGEGDFEARMERVRRVSEVATERAGAWRKELDEAGGLVGHRWRQMAPVIDRLKDEDGGISDLRAFEDRLTKADRLGRQVDGAAPSLEENAVEAAARLRQVRVHDLLLAQAERARLDHWYGEDPNERPYYRLVGSRFVADARSIFRESPLARATQGRLDEKGKLEISGRPRLVLTSERSAGLAYKVVATGSVPEGLPVVRPVPDRLLELQGDNGGFRTVERGEGSDKAEFFVGSPLINSAETDAKLNRPIIEPAELRVEGSFRGQPLTYRTEIQLHPVPDTVAIGPPSPRPQEASVAVRASQEIIDRFGEGTGSYRDRPRLLGEHARSRRRRPEKIRRREAGPLPGPGHSTPRARRSVSGRSARSPRGSRWCRIQGRPGPSWQRSDRPSSQAEPEPIHQTPQARRPLGRRATRRAWSRHSTHLRPYLRTPHCSRRCGRPPTRT